MASERYLAPLLRSQASTAEIMARGMRATTSGSRPPAYGRPPFLFSGFVVDMFSRQWLGLYHNVKASRGEGLISRPALTPAKGESYGQG